MKRKKLLNKLVGFLDMEEHKQRKQRDELKALLKKLKKKKVELEDKMKSEADNRKRKRLGKELEIIKAQREKGLGVLRDLMES